MEKNQVSAYIESLHHSSKDLASTEVIKPILLCCSFPQEPCSTDSYGPWELKECSEKATVATVTQRAYRAPEIALISNYKTKKYTIFKSFSAELMLRAVKATGRSFTQDVSKMEKGIP